MCCIRNVCSVIPLPPFECFHSKFNLCFIGPILPCTALSVRIAFPCLPAEPCSYVRLGSSWLLGKPCRKTYLAIEGVMFCLKCLDEETIRRMGPQVGELGRQHLKAILLDRKTLCRNWLASVWIQAESCSQSRQGTLPQLFRKALEETSTLQCKHWQGVIHDSAFCCNSRNLCANVALLKRHSTWKKQVPAASLPCFYFYGCFQK